MPTNQPVTYVFGENAMLKQFLMHNLNIFVTTARTADKTIGLVENEVDNLHAEQQLRLDVVKDEREKKLIELGIKTKPNSDTTTEQ